MARPQIELADPSRYRGWRHLAAALESQTSTIGFPPPRSLSLGRMRTRNVTVAGYVSVIGSATKSLQNPTGLRWSPAAALFPQRPKLALQAAQFRYALFHVTDMCIQKRVDRTTVFVCCGAKSEQNPNFVQSHVE